MCMPAVPVIAIRLADPVSVSVLELLPQRAGPMVLAHDAAATPGFIG
jgi:hypothetical protein